MLLGVPVWGPHNKEYSRDYSILGSILGSFNFGKLSYEEMLDALLTTEIQ